ncbi:hypothetical protein L207DRAFT_573069 [Hyaloscypha variabilis F]|uniref:NmrA-like domain-containing protein n=1 Tax=Hyaloscypha variabilis (strain UAMH 11265 / GT02V1 / F) TaxID=1149755 RepID=A0A2J6QXF3_HYAVF|nr:hypothetical protein L207DRAFT_573069 [Hyaloscypha variabilis F]
MSQIKESRSSRNAVISTLGTLSLSASQTALITAASHAGVKRFIPSEFGSDTTNPKTSLLPIFAAKIEAQKLLKEIADKGGMSYTLVFTGPFLDWGVERGVMKVREKEITVFDGGEGRFSATTLETVGRAVCRVLEREKETENSVVRVQDTGITLRRLLEMGKRAVGEDGWTVQEATVEDVLERAWEGWRGGKRELGTMLGFILAAVWGVGYGGYFEKTDNEMLGLKDMTDEEVQGVVERAARE